MWRPPITPLTISTDQVNLNLFTACGSPAVETVALVADRERGQGAPVELGHLAGRIQGLTLEESEDSSMGSAAMAATARHRPGTGGHRRAAGRRCHHARQHRRDHRQHRRLHFQRWRWWRRWFPATSRSTAAGAVAVAKAAACTATAATAAMAAAPMARSARSMLPAASAGERPSGRGAVELAVRGARAPRRDGLRRARLRTSGGGRRGGQGRCAERPHANVGRRTQRIAG